MLTKTRKRLKEIETRTAMMMDVAACICREMGIDPKKMADKMTEHKDNILYLSKIALALSLKPITCKTNKKEVKKYGKTNKKMEKNRTR